MTYQNVDPIAPVNVLGEGNTSTNNAPSVTTTVANTMLLACFGEQGPSDLPTPGGMTQRFEGNTSSTPNSSAACFDQAQAAVGASGTRTSNSGNDEHTQMIALQPAMIANYPEYRILSGTASINASGTLGPVRPLGGRRGRVQAGADRHRDADRRRRPSRLPRPRRRRPRRPRPRR